jgi:hypothetical protein
VVVWIFLVLAAVGVFVVAAVMVGREAFRLGHQPPPTILDLDEAVHFVADDLPDDAQGRLTYEEVRTLVAAQLELLRARGVLAHPGEELAASTNGDSGGGGDRGSGGNAEPPVVIADDDAVATLLGEVEEHELDVDDHDVFLVVSSLHRYLASIGAVGPTA